MKILHTSDWHLGKKLYKKDRLEEQKLFLNWLLETIKEKDIQVLIIAGDIFDTAIPSTEALATFFQFIKDCENLSLEEGGSLLKVLAIGGNHDNPLLVETPRPFLKENFFHITGKLTLPKEGETIEEWKKSYVFEVEEEGVSTCFTLLPFFRPRELVGLECSTENSEEEPLLQQLKAWLSLTKTPADHQVLIGHHLFGSFLASGSEQGVALSGLDSLPLSMFSDYDLLCLGHIHKKQVVKNEKPFAIYCGSPFPLRFSESNQKSCEFFEISEKEIVNKQITIPLFRGLFRVSCKKEDVLDQISNLLSNNKAHPTTPHFLELELLIDKPEPNLIDKIREDLKDFPLVLLNFFTKIEGKEEKEKTLTYQQISNTTTIELFKLYLDTLNVDDEKNKILTETLSSCLQELREERGSISNEN
ncbi:MAG: exonuclease SbcCD subunit D [Halobacteriovoraceae bacterium]|nr:exonuclease SbcCD subunit D [Halobacteriovoraceae bacterium]